MPRAAAPPGGAAPRGARSPTTAGAQGRCPVGLKRPSPAGGGDRLPPVAESPGALRPARCATSGKSPNLSGPPAPRPASADALERPREGKAAPTPRAGAESRCRRPGLPTCRRPLRCAKFKLCLRERGWRRRGEGGGPARQGPSGPPRSPPPPGPGPAHLQRRVGSHEVPGGLRQPHSPPFDEQRHRGGGRPGRPREAAASPAPGRPRPPPPGRPAPPPAGAAGNWSPTGQGAVHPGAAGETEGGAARPYGRCSPSGRGRSATGPLRRGRWEM